MSAPHYELFWSVQPSRNTIKVQRRLVQFLPKEKFVRRKEKTIVIDKWTLGYHKIPETVERTEQTVERTRSWHGGGMQQDDINCSEVVKDQVITYDRLALMAFAVETMKQYSVKP